MLILIFFFDVKFLCLKLFWDYKSKLYVWDDYYLYKLECEFVIKFINLYISRMKILDYIVR